MLGYWWSLSIWFSLCWIKFLVWIKKIQLRVRGRNLNRIIFTIKSVYMSLLLRIGLSFLWLWIILGVFSSRLGVATIWLPSCLFSQIWMLYSLLLLIRFFTNRDYSKKLLELCICLKTSICTLPMSTYTVIIEGWQHLKILPQLNRESLFMSSSLEHFAIPTEVSIKCKETNNINLFIWIMLYWVSYQLLVSQHLFTYYLELRQQSSF